MEILILGGGRIDDYGWPFVGLERRCSASDVGLEVEWRVFPIGLVVNLVVAAAGLAGIGAQVERSCALSRRFQYGVGCLLGLCIPAAFTILMYKYELDILVALEELGVCKYESRDKYEVIRNGRVFRYMSEDSRGVDWYLWIPLFFSLSCAAYRALWIGVAAVGFVWRRAVYGRNTNARDGFKDDGFKETHDSV